MQYTMYVQCTRTGLFKRNVDLIDKKLKILYKQKTQMLTPYFKVMSRFKFYTFIQSKFFIVILSMTRPEPKRINFIEKPLHYKMLRISINLKVLNFSSTIFF